jgi:hypothetical protein
MPYQLLTLSPVTTISSQNTRTAMIPESQGTRHDDKMISGRMELPGYPDFSTFESHSDELIDLMRGPQTSLSSQLALPVESVQEVMNNNIVLVFDYKNTAVQATTAATFPINIFSRTNVGVVDATFDAPQSELAAAILQSSTPETYNNAVLSSALAPFFKELFRSRVEAPVSAEENQVVIQRKENNAVYIHLYISADDTYLQKFHYGILRNPSFIDLLINSPAFRKTVVSVDASGQFHEDTDNQHLAALPIRINTSAFNNIYHTSADITDPCFPMTCAHAQGTLEEEILWLNNFFVTPWLCVPAP